MTFFMTIACATCPTWIGFIAVRVLQGFFATSAQVLGMTVIQDMYAPPNMVYISEDEQVLIQSLQFSFRRTRSQDWDLGMVNFDWYVDAPSS